MQSNSSFLFGAVLSLFLSITGLLRADQVVKIDGSSTVYPIIEAVSEEFSKAEPSIRVTAGVSGTGGGFKKFIAKEIDICNASRPAKKEELADLEKNGMKFARKLILNRMRDPYSLRC
jgi:phosphate transport system substrate-binding protein